MRADNTHHIIAAAQQRHELTRAKAIQALRTRDAEGQPSHLRVKILAQIPAGWRAGRALAILGWDVLRREAALGAANHLERTAPLSGVCLRRSDELGRGRRR